MKIISQLSVFDYKEIEILGDLERCKLLISNVPDEKIINKLSKKFYSFFPRCHRNYCFHLYS